MENAGRHYMVTSWSSVLFSCVGVIRIQLHDGLVLRRRRHSRRFECRFVLLFFACASASSRLCAKILCLTSLSVSFFVYCAYFAVKDFRVANGSQPVTKM